MTKLVIRPAFASDHPHLRRAIIELQEYERRLHATRRPGEAVADAYLTWMLQRTEIDGVVLVAEVAGVFAGFVAGWVEHEDNIAETPDSNRFAYVSDLCVLPAHRGVGIAGCLLDAITDHLKQAGITRVRITTLAANRSARASYERAGFQPYEITYEKEIDESRQ
jgi:ribosomal protein S18 acetylase RimI-like enzyme